MNIITLLQPPRIVFGNGCAPQLETRAMTLWGWLEKRRSGDSAERRYANETSAAHCRDVATGANK